MTPIFGFSQDVDTALEEAYQSMVLQGFTTSELVRARAYQPDAVLPAPNLRGAIHPMFSRNNWSQDDHKIFPGGRRTVYPVGSLKTNPILRYDIGGKVGVLDASTDDFLWGVLQPSLLLATRIISTHPVWEALLNIYHLRPVPLTSDSRTAAQLAEDGGISRTSFWYVSLPKSSHALPKQRLTLNRTGSTKTTRPCTHQQPQ